MTSTSLRADARLRKKWTSVYPKSMMSSILRTRLYFVSSYFAMTHAVPIATEGCTPRPKKGRSTTPHSTPHQNKSYQKPCRLFLAWLDDEGAKYRQKTNINSRESQEIKRVCTIKSRVPDRCRSQNLEPRIQRGIQKTK